MPFGMVSGVGRGMNVLHGGGDRRRGSSVGEFGAFHCNKWRLCCVVVRQRRALPKLLWDGLVPLPYLSRTEASLASSRTDAVHCP